MIQILKKSYAKLNGSYNNIDIKNIEEILRDFTYASVITLNNSTDDLVEQLNEDLLSELGLNPDFDYSILIVYMLNSNDLRNEYPR